MAQTYSLAAYAISINTRGDRNDRQVLSDFNNGQDFLDYVETMMNGWKLNTDRGDEYVPVNRDGNDEEGNAFRLSRKGDGTYNLYRRGRYLSGILETGEYGTQEDGVNVTTGAVTFHKHAEEALMKPFYFLFYVPEDSLVAFLLVEKISNYGILTVLNKAILEYYAASPSAESFVLKIYPLSVSELVSQKMRALRYEAKKVELRKIQKADLKLSRLSGNTVNDDGVMTTIVYTAPKNTFLDIARFIDRIQHSRNVANTMYVVEEDLSCNDIAITVNIGGQEKVLSLQHIQSLGMTMDISHQVQLGGNGYPTYESVHAQANQLISYIIDQFQIVR